jgi:hypothetical protein
MTRFRSHLRSNAVAYLALFVALGGTSYAAFRLPAGSVGNRALKNHSISPIKFQRDKIAGYVRDWATVDTAGHISASRPRAHLVDWVDGPGTPVPGGLVSWDQPIPRSCFALATTASSGPGASSATAEVFSNGNKNGPDVGVKLLLSASQTAVNVAVICPQP